MLYEIERDSRVPAVSDVLRCPPAVPDSAGPRGRICPTPAGRMRRGSVACGRHTIARRTALGTAERSTKDSSELVDTALGYMVQLNHVAERGVHQFTAVLGRAMVPPCSENTGSGGTATMGDAVLSLPWTGHTVLFLAWTGHAVLSLTWSGLAVPSLRWTAWR